MRKSFYEGMDWAAKELRAINTALLLLKYDIPFSDLQEAAIGSGVVGEGLALDGDLLIDPFDFYRIFDYIEIDYERVFFDHIVDYGVYIISYWEDDKKAEITSKPLFVEEGGSCSNQKRFSDYCERLSSDLFICGYKLKKTKEYCRYSDDIWQ